MKRLFGQVKLIVFIYGCFLFSIQQAYSQVKLPRIVRDSMILQRDVKLKIWGWAGKNEKVNVKLNGKTYKTKADAEGNWSVLLAPLKSGGPYTMDITGSNKITLKDILIGDVWFCSGQSNMVHQMNIHDVRYANDIKNANYPDIRQFWIPTIATVAGPQKDLPTGFWQPAVGEQVRPFSAIAYFFAKYIYDKYKIPIGIINSSVGGTAIEAWTSEEGFKEFPNILTTIARNKDTTNRGNRGNANAAARPPQQRPEDKGMTEKWYDPSYVPKGWFPMAVPGYWEDQGVKDLNGIVWFRREINVPASMTIVPAKVFLGRIVDADELYINGKRIANTTYMYPQRRYPVPDGVLKPGKNIFVVRVTNNSGKGGFVPDKPYQLFAGKDTIDLTGYWQYKVGLVNVPVRPGGGFAGGGGGGVNAQNAPTGLYNAMVAPVINYAVKGVLWYQGESNTGRADDYAKYQPALIADWRNKWNDPNLPFLYVQLPGLGDYNYIPSESQWAGFREAQVKSLSVPNTAMAVAIDLGEWNDIHPDRKKEVGDRLAVAADNMVYGDKSVVPSGPLFQSATIEGNKIIISFTNISSGLASSDGEELKEFAIAGDDKKFVWGKARIEGDKIVISSDEVPQPKYVRYAWADTPVYPNLINKEGLPASPFRTDK